ncbi:peroxisome biogenesis protein 5 [Tanacetum coccineum]|uniref:Peroxisome biogenesis protein 5 n=1 Tax=Tanacetum coccineum TaxID=301880 RepID=A0ABQ5DMF7_9ASTR
MGVYEFSDLNPFAKHLDPVREGHELFRKGLLSEAVLALDAEVLKNPDNTEGSPMLMVTEMTKHIRVRDSRGNTTASELGQFSPILVWFLRVHTFCFLFTYLLSEFLDAHLKTDC